MLLSAGLASPTMSSGNATEEPRLLPVTPGFSLPQTCGPVAWAGGRWPNMDWRDGQLLWIGWEAGRLAWRTVWQETDGQVWVTGARPDGGDERWAEVVLGCRQVCPAFSEPVLARLSNRFTGLRPFAYGSIYEGLIAAIVGQSISVAAAAVAQTRLCALVSPSVERSGRTFWPLPLPDQLASADASLIRRAGVTWRRAEALVAVSRAALEGNLPAREAALRQPEETAAMLRRLPAVGPWTANSVLLWGVGAPDAYPTGDVALLRAARAAFDDPDLDLKGLDHRAEEWRPARAWAARLLWTDLLGIAR